MIHPSFKTYRLYNATPVKDIEGYEWILSNGMGYPVGAGELTPWEPDKQTVNDDRMKAFAESVTARVFVLDVEHLKANALGRIVDILETIRSYRPDVALGVWSLFPSSEFWTVQNYVQMIDWRNGHPHAPKAHYTVARQAELETAFHAWQARNRLTAAKLLPHVDALFPSIYPATDVNPKDLMADAAWKLARNAEIQVDEAIALANGKPVFPFWYPFVSATKKPASTALTEANALATSKANGHVLWGDRNTSAAALTQHAKVMRRAITQAANVGAGEV